MSEKILVVDDEESIRWVLGTSLEKSGFDVEYGENGSEALEKASSDKYSLILLDINMPDISGFDVFNNLRNQDIDSPIIFITAENTMSNAIDSIQLGAYDYISKPFDLDEVIKLAENAIKNYKNTKKLTRSDQEKESRIIQLGEIIGNSKEMLNIFKTIGRVADKDITVLVTGESGTGKELIARAIHQNSERKNNKLVSINIAAIPRELIESELFGHEKGAFTGAVSAKKGRFEEADGGTLQIDEIGELSVDLQSKLLRVLEENKIYRLGSEKPIDVDVRVIACTNRNLRTEVNKGNFREDLFYRLNAITINIPPLRERAGDIELLIDHFIKKYSSELKTEKKVLSEKSKALLVKHDWPGNVRELENTIKRLLVLNPDNIINSSIINEEIKTQSSSDAGSEKDEIDKAIKNQISMLIDNVDEHSSDVYPKVMNIFEKHLIQLVMAKVNGNKKKAAEILGINRNTLSKKISDLELDLK